mmetsp:Transcript_128414/g.256492  ORF Transcript_128414/g.256492 Transcript_128414/m.256492 type:complete len:167 (-) Transcript_128414:156-656(-)|eukprot:CAMPEP_0172723728 /NCGR_PEP_ID=MMETSP1074-20121228/84341_1 /TAXON_ID=2916 /ORGANISM="Ceratium fusus, Strain PA161109" /LENGTH=166 /DNA_ID=CAMNT_0013550021 /DNA_START=87 /DNA_END=587 /DNA_ORIENTATION=-
MAGWYRLPLTVATISLANGCATVSTTCADDVSSFVQLEARQRHLEPEEQTTDRQLLQLQKLTQVAKGIAFSDLEDLVGAQANSKTQPPTKLDIAEQPPSKVDSKAQLPTRVSAAMSSRMQPPTKMSATMPSKPKPLKQLPETQSVSWAQWFSELLAFAFGDGPERV